MYALLRPLVSARPNPVSIRAAALGAVSVLALCAMGSPSHAQQTLPEVTIQQSAAGKAKKAKKPGQPSSVSQGAEQGQSEADVVDGGDASLPRSWA